MDETESAPPERPRHPEHGRHPRALTQRGLRRVDLGTDVTTWDLSILNLVSWYRA
jgi:hypothetical protein